MFRVNVATFFLTLFVAVELMIFTRGVLVFLKTGSRQKSRLDSSRKLKHKRFSWHRPHAWTSDCNSGQIMTHIVTLLSIQILSLLSLFLIVIKKFLKDTIRTQIAIADTFNGRKW